MKSSIQGSIIIWLILIIGSIGALVSLFVTFRVQNMLFGDEKNTHHIVNIEDAKQIKLILDNSTLFTKMLATRTRVVEFLQDPTNIRRTELVTIFDEYQKDNFQYLSIYLMDATGSALISTDRSFIGNNYGFRPYFIEAMKGGSYVDVALGKTTGKLGVYFSYPIKEGSGKVIGVVAIKLEPTSIYTSLGDAPNKESTIMITNLHGVILFSTKKDRILTSLGKLSPSYQTELGKNNPFQGALIKPLWYDEAQKIVEGYEGPKTIEYMDVKDNEQELLSIVRIQNYPFYLATEVGLNESIEKITDITRILGIGIFGASLFCLLIVSSVIRRILSPLQILKSYAEIIGKGDFSQKMKIKTGNELEDLGNVFSQVQDNLKDLYAGLETKVEEKTKELKQQLVEIEKTKSAMINLLEDVNSQKEEIENHAFELQKFELAMKNAHDHIIITNPDGVVLFANKAAEKITGYTEQEIIGQKAGNKGLWGGSMDKTFYETFWKCIKTDKQVFVGEFKNKRKNGEVYIAEAQVSPILDSQREVQYFVSIERDITQAKEIDRMKTEFISLASHQLRTPLSAMKWFLEMLLNGDAGKLNDEQREFVVNVEQSNNRMVELVNSLLNVSRIESGRIIVEPKPTNLKDLIDEVLTEVKAQYADKKQSINFSIHSDLPLIPLDKKLIRQVYLNLLTNAMKYSPPETDIVVIVSKENDMIISQITDNGYGIPHNEQVHIFTKFYRATNAVKKETEGNGLGLYLVQSIVESSGGKIWFTSGDQKGTSFFFTIPLTGMKQRDGEVHMS